MSRVRFCKQLDIMIAEFKSYAGQWTNGRPSGFPFKRSFRPSPLDGSAHALKEIRGSRLGNLERLNTASVRHTRSLSVYLLRVQ